MTMTLDVRLLGEFAIVSDGAPLKRLNTPRLQALMAYLLLHRDVQLQRRQLAFLFWPESSEAQAQNNLRQVLFTLRGAWPRADTYIEMSARTIYWRSDLPVRLDVEEVYTLVETIMRADAAHDDATLRDAGNSLLALYQADILPGCYDEWLQPERERLRDSFCRAVERLIRHCEARREYASAIRYVRQLVRMDPLSEGAYRTLMRLQALNGEGPGELLAFQDCVTILQRELGIAPSSATVELHRQLQPQRV